MSEFSERWERIHDLDRQLIWRQQELAERRRSGDREGMRESALEILILRKQIRELARR